MRGRRGLFYLAFYTILVIGAGYAGWYLWTVSSAMNRVENVAMGQFIGPADAEKTIIEFIDYRCPYCHQLEPVMKEVLRRHPDLRIIYRHYPVFGKASVIDAGVALAAGMQGKFEEAHDMMMAAQRSEILTDAEIEAMAVELGLDMRKFQIDRKGPEIGVLLLDTMDIADALGIRATPTFVVGDIIYSMKEGDVNADSFDKVIAEAYGTK